MSRALAAVLLVALVACGDKKPTAAVLDAGAPLLTLVATCAEVKGQAQVRRAGKPYWEPIAEGGTLRDGDWVRTLNESHARLEFMAGGSLELSENAVVVVELPSPTDVPAGVALTPRVSVESGEVQATPAYGDQEVKPLLVRTPDGKTSLLEGAKEGPHTTFRLSASDAGVAIAASHGEGTVRSGGSALAVSSRAGAMLSADAAPQTVELPEFPASWAPGIDARLKFEEGKTQTKLLWSPVDEALGYRVEVARDLSFSVGVRTVDVPNVGYTLIPEGKGLYLWRVATRGKGAIIGEYGFARRIFYEVDEPKELLLGPEDGMQVSYSSELPTVTFTWQAGTQNSTYRVLVARGGDPQADPLINFTTQSQRADVSTLTAGEFHWGVYLDGRVLKPLFLKPRKLIIKIVPKAVVKTPKSINKWE